MLPPDTPTALSPLETAVWRTIAYADIFDYPLTSAEIHRYLEGMVATPAEIEHVLTHGRLIPHHLLCHPPYYLLPGRSHLCQIRQARTQAAQTLWPVALHYGRLIASLPFVRMVAVTGSLAVNNPNEHADIDYLVVTQNGRVWLSRAFIITLVRLAARHNHTLCPNYILAETALSFPDHTLYTARELTQMVPLHGLPIYQQMRQLNPWVNQFIPNAPQPPQPPLPPPHPHWQKILELPWRTPIGHWVDQWEMTRKIRKFTPYTSHEADFNKDWCKGHFDAHKQRVLTAYYHREP